MKLAAILSNIATTEKEISRSTSHFSLKQIVLSLKYMTMANSVTTEKFTPRSLEDVKPGGLGTHFMKEIMDEVSYCTDREEGTLLTMIKRLKGTHHSAREGEKGKQ